MRLRAAVCLVCVLLPPSPPARADQVTEWTLEADRLGRGRANWRSLAVMHAAIHDAVNAITPVYRRWAPPAAGEPKPAGANVDAAIAAAAAEVLRRLHPLRESEVDEFLQAALARAPREGMGEGVALGRAIGAAAADRHKDDGFDDSRFMAVSDSPGKWRPVPESFETGLTNSIRPFLFPSRDGFAGVPPPALGSPAALRDLEEVRTLGSEHSATRTAAQTEAARFWAYQSSQRGFVLLAVSLLDRDPSGDLAAHARLMSQLTAAMADSAILIWAEKERYSAWRPITAIRAGGPGWTADPAWTPLIETPGHPEYPSGHASDCFVGAGFLSAAFDLTGPVTYVAESSLPLDGPSAPAMGQHAQIGARRAAPRTFASLRDAALECSESRIWAGAHFRAAETESRRVAAIIVEAALRTAPKY